MMNSLHQGAPNSILLIPVISSVIALPASKWGSVLPTGLHLDLQTFLSVEDCLLLCWRSSRCQSVNYYRLPTACELNMVDRAGVDGLQLLPGSIYSEKLSWNETEIFDICNRRCKLPKFGQKNSETVFCPEPDFIPSTELIFGNLRSIGSKIRYACAISSTGATRRHYPVGISECLADRTWSQAWRPCREPDKNYALGMVTNQSSTYIEPGIGPSVASYAVDGEHYNDLSTRTFECAHGPERNGWWYVDLGERRVVGRIVVYVRRDAAYKWFQKQRFTVSDTKPLTESTAGFLCGFFKGPITDHETENPVTIRCRSPMVGRYVRVTAADGHVITLCELEVYTRVD